MKHAKAMDKHDSLENQPATETLRLGGVERSWLAGLRRGLAGRCPSCGSRSLFSRYVKMAPRCSACGQDFEPYRADDAPAYFTILIVGHIVVPLMLIVEQHITPALWVHAAIWVPLTLVLSLSLLPRCKGAIIGLQWGLKMRPGEMGPEQI